jgi:hypothetical protein
MMAAQTPSSLSKQDVRPLTGTRRVQSDAGRPMKGNTCKVCTNAPCKPTMALLNPTHLNTGKTAPYTINLLRDESTRLQPCEQLLAGWIAMLLANDDGDTSRQPNVTHPPQLQVSACRVDGWH